jgi:alpha-L-arabinofuranosidase
MEQKKTMNSHCSISRKQRQLMAAPLLLLATFCSITPNQCAAGQPPIALSVRADHPGAHINPAMWGIFFEDINLGADGGLYAELVKNRGFEFPEPMMGWSQAATNARGKLEVRNEEPFDPANPHYLRVSSEGSEAFGVSNEGFRGMGIHEGEEYEFSARIRHVAGEPSVIVEIVGHDGTILAHSQLARGNSHWQRLTTPLSSKGTDAKAHLSVFLEGKGVVDFDMISLFPRHTWKGRTGGLRADMVQKLADLKPGFMRFPGGCIVEGSDLSRRYQWKTTIGPIEDRKLIINRWNYEFKHRPAPDYFQSFGLGFFEFFQLCEDIRAEPLPILNCGMACQFNSGELVPLDRLDPFIQDALDLIEFANGPAASGWGATRAAMGHPAPFHLKMLGVGNEQWGPQYIERYALFARTLKQKHPDIKLISAAGPAPGDDRFQFLWPKLRELRADIVDEHCYANPVWFLSNADRYDKYDRKGPKVFMGEYAAQSVAIVSPNNRNNLECALAEAAYMTGLERNADVVRMASYAPLFANSEGWQWTPDLIWVDSLRVCSTPNYFVQQLFMQNRGDVVLPVTHRAPVPELLPQGGIGLGTLDSAAEFKELRVVSGSQVLYASDFASGAANWSGGTDWSVHDGSYHTADAKKADPRGKALSFTGDNNWADYTLSLKARKLSGADGFLVMVRAQGPQEYVVWNLGGWHNEFHGVLSHLGEQDDLITRTPATIETGRWYDLKLELKGTRLDCYLDGKLLHRVTVPVRRTPDFFASAARDNMTGEVILKVVNPTPQSRAASVRVDGLKSESLMAHATVLSGSNPGDENSLDEPIKIARGQLPAMAIKPNFDYTFRPYSMTVIRIGEARLQLPSGSSR